jgi:CRP/FNR family transcriptional regulator
MNQLQVASAASHDRGIVVPELRQRVAPMARAGSLHEMLHRMGVDGPCSCQGEVGLDAVPIWRVQQAAVLLHEGDGAQTLYVVRSGSFKRVRSLEDGYEQVLALVLPGGLLGVEALHGDIHPSSAVALEDSTLYALPAHALASIQQRCPALVEGLWRGVSRQLAQAAETAEMMAPVASDARLARFVLWLSRRMAEAGQSPRHLLLRMGRRDIASLLGVAHETVSRSFSLLADIGCLRVAKREVEILDLRALQQRARCTRGWVGASEGVVVPLEARDATPIAA